MVFSFPFCKQLTASIACIQTSYRIVLVYNFASKKTKQEKEKKQKSMQLPMALHNNSRCTERRTDFILLFIIKYPVMFDSLCMFIHTSCTS